MFIHRCHSIAYIATCALCSLIAPTVALANQPGQYSTSQPTPSELQGAEEIDQELQSLEKKIEKLRKEELNKEMHAQPYMFDSWHQYSKEIEAAEEDEKHIEDLKKQVDEIKKKKG